VILHGQRSPELDLSEYSRAATGKSMTRNNELAIWSMVALGLVLYVFTFIMVWSSTADYRENISRPVTSSSATIQNSLK
jgi:hypothetical protein